MLIRAMTFFLLSVVLATGTTTAEEPVHFASSKLKSAVETALGVFDPTPTDMLGLTRFQASFGFYDVADLTGFEYALNLETLLLDQNRITALSPLAGLSNLRTLDVSDNEILSDLSGIAGLTQLVDLDLHRNSISDLSPLAGLTHLKRLILRNNRLTDIGSLSGMSDLEILIIRVNQIYDISALTGLTHLRQLDLTSNSLPFDSDAYWNDLQTICNNNPGISLWYDPNPNPPTGVSASDGTYANRVQITWNEVPNGPDLITHYRVYRATSSTGSKTPISGWQMTTTFDDTTAQSGTIYFYWVQAAPYSNGSEATGFSVPDTGQLPGFVSPLKSLIVDDDAPGDPGPGQSDLSDPKEDGTQGHPFDSIQEAIRAAGEGASISVHPGIYRENIDLQGKRIRLTGADPNDRSGSAYPVIAGISGGPVVSFVHGEDPNCRVTGFVISEGQGPSGGAIRCQASSPTISHCLITGNRTTDTGGSAVLCSQSAAAFIHCTIADNAGGAQGGGMTLVNSPVMLSHCIVWSNTPKQIVLSGTGSPLIRYTDVAGGWPGSGNILVDPLFVRSGYWADAGNPNVVLGPTNPKAVWIEGDYHLMSQAGRWDSTTRTWVLDEATSGCIDAGDPDISLGYEPAPNDGVVNLGAYGGTAQASKSYVVADGPVTFKSQVLKSAVETSLGVFDPTPTDMLGLTRFQASFGFYDVADLTGFEFALNLETLLLDQNRITALSPLAGLTNLRTLDVSDNESLSDLSGLAGLTQLEDLDLHRNAISDLTPLAGLTALKRLILRNNRLTDIGSLSGMSDLEILIIRVNQIYDISALTGLTHLRQLDLTSNSLLFDSDAYWNDLQTVYDNNPGLSLWYDPNPNPPTEVSASDGTYANKVQIAWNEVRNGPSLITHYQVYRATSSTDPKTPISGWQMATTFDDTTAQSGTTYFYWVQAAHYSDGSETTGYSVPDTGWR